MNGMMAKILEGCVQKDKRANCEYSIDEHEFSNTSAHGRKA
jgi:hypothetical protein